MLIDVIIYAIVTMVSLRFAAPWLTSGKAAFTARENKTLVMRLAAVALIVAAYSLLSIAANASQNLLALPIVAVLGKGLAAVIVFGLAFAALDVLIMAVTIKGASMLMKKTVKSESFGSAVCASLIITVLATIAQTAVGVVLVNLSQ